MQDPETPDEVYERLLRETQLSEYIRELAGVLGSYSLYVVSKAELQMLIGQLRELRARRIKAGREPDDEVNAPADMCCPDCREVQTGGELCSVCVEGRALWEEGRGGELAAGPRLRCGAFSVRDCDAGAFGRAVDCAECEAGCPF